MANPVWDLVDRRARLRPADPVLTFVAADGTRTELSGRTLANNVAKSAGALRDEGMLDIGARVTIDIDWHWQRAVWALACWSVGAGIAPDGDLCVVDPDHAVGQAGGWVVSMHPFGLPNATVPDRMLDAASLARLQPDELLADDVDPHQMAMQDGGATWTIDELCTAAATLSEHQQVVADERIAVPPVVGPAGWAWLLVPLLANASLVLIGTGADPVRVADAESARLITAVS